MSAITLLDTLDHLGVAISALPGRSTWRDDESGDRPSVTIDLTQKVSTQARADSGAPAKEPRDQKAQKNGARPTHASGR